MCLEVNPTFKQSALLKMSIVPTTLRYTGHFMLCYLGESHFFGVIFIKILSYEQRRAGAQENGSFSCVGVLKGPKSKQVKDRSPRKWVLFMCGNPERAQKQASEGQEPKKMGPFHVWKP